MCRTEIFMLNFFYTIDIFIIFGKCKQNFSKTSMHRIALASASLLIEVMCCMTTIHNAGFLIYLKKFNPVNNMMLNSHDFV